MQTISLKTPGLFSPVVVPKHAVQQRFRAPKKNIPQTVFERNRVLQFVRNYVAEFNPVPPLPMDQLKEHADRLVTSLGCDPIYRDYIGVLLNNEMWREAVAAVPFERAHTIYERGRRSHHLSSCSSAPAQADLIQRHGLPPHPRG
jgi:hypothetical protein